MKNIKDNTQLLIIAAKRGDVNNIQRLQCVALLIPVTEKRWIHSALCVAVQRNDIECVKLLMKECDPKEGNSLPLQLAAEYNNEECIAVRSFEPPPSFGHFTIPNVKPQPLECLETTFGR